ncbi:hypothetical protein WCE55_02360 [Luteimonas sp. MJ293]|uniref:hypothetical protein n=1 Tax=Luteimonas sp. MJ146 TaxID=3129240 RepID=UPI0031B9E615
MSVNDVRDYLLKQMAELADSDMDADKAKLVIEKAKASSQVAATYISSVRAEIEAARLVSDTGLLPGGVSKPEQVDWAKRLPFDGKYQPGRRPGLERSTQ